VHHRKLLSGDSGKALALIISGYLKTSATTVAH
jgi:hypothetical protein